LARWTDLIWLVRPGTQQVDSESFMTVLPKAVKCQEPLPYCAQACTVTRLSAIDIESFDALSPHEWPEPHSSTPANHRARTVGWECVSPRPHSTGKPLEPPARVVARSMLNLLAHSLFTRGLPHLARQLLSTAPEAWNVHVSRAPDRSSIHSRRMTQGTHIVYSIVH
jgi:hypothetical protein